MKLEDDQDIHVVIAEPGKPQATMIAGFPDPACRGAVGAARCRRAQ